MSARRVWWLVPMVFVLAVGAGFVSRSSDDELVFNDVQKQSRRFIELEQSIRLDPKQDAVRKAALSKIPAPCCSDNSALTCCCPCNLARTIWGLSEYLIAEKGADADTVRRKVEEWIRFVNPDGFSGDVCYTAGCGRPFAKNGCGGMSPSQLVF